MHLLDKPLKVLHYPQVPCKPFEVEVKDEQEAVKIMQVLAYQHLWLFENKIIADYSNMIMIQMYDNGEWTDYWNEDEQMEWQEFQETYFPNY